MVDHSPFTMNTVAMGVPIRAQSSVSFGWEGTYTVLLLVCMFMINAEYLVTHCYVILWSIISIIK
jgi:hypothetical protein